MTAADRARKKPLTKEEVAFLGGQYEALAWVLTSPHLSGYLYDVIRERALEIKARLEAAGEKFTEYKR